jgi:DNA helicase-2/ATP-dependent DNA helicase PcrA
MAVNFNVGDRVVHRLFGKGTITDILPIRGDVIVTVEFDSGQRKKLCALITKLKKEEAEKKE